jgi:hypothetical protein
MIDIVIYKEATWFGKTYKATHTRENVSEESLEYIKDIFRRSVDAKELNWFIINDSDGNLIDAYRS